jgi:hypothetical protein
MSFNSFTTGGQFLFCLRLGRMICGLLVIGALVVLALDIQAGAGQITVGQDARPDSQRASASATKVWIQAGRFTLPELAEKVDRADALRYENGVATLHGALELSGPTAELVIGPGETLRMCHVPVPEGEDPQPQQVLDRRIFLTEGKVDWRDCTIEGFYWIGVNPAVRGQWENVKFAIAPDHDDLYPLFYLGSSFLSWQGGRVEGAQSTHLMAPGGPWMRRDVEMRMEKVHFVTGGGLIFPVPIRSISAQFAFRDCTFQRLVANDSVSLPYFHVEASAADLGSFAVRLTRPTFQGMKGKDLKVEGNGPSMVVRGSTAQLALRLPPNLPIHILDPSPDLRAVGSWSAYQKFCVQVEQLHASLERPELASHTGSLWWLRDRLSRVDRGLELATQIGQCSTSDLHRWQTVSREVEEDLALDPSFLATAQPCASPL